MTFSAVSANEKSKIFPLWDTGGGFMPQIKNSGNKNNKKGFQLSL
jgi:hypothetical protein